MISLPILSLLYTVVVIPPNLPILPGPPTSLHDLPIVLWQTDYSVQLDACTVELHATIGRGGCWPRSDGYMDCGITAEESVTVYGTCVLRRNRG